MDPLAESYLDRIAELKSQYIIHVANGSAEDYSSYKKTCGILEGIAICEREMKEIVTSTGSEDAIYDDLE